ncbi:hypothetical protein M3Y97_00346800 [Aphelenchoides bicaudatus]|nr:hypothetical protein M3Y97_00346800 [Aphelenchoides bicaudatus]
MNLFASVLTLLVVASAIDAGAQQSKPSGTSIKISLKDVTLAVSGSSEDSLGTPKAITFGQKHSPAVPLDGKQQLQLKFKIVDDKAQPVTVHQAFVIFIHSTTKQEIAYVSEADTQTKVYTFELNLKNHAKEFGGLSGLYNIHLILGDSKVTNPVNWNFADIQLKIPSVKAAEVPKSQVIDYEPKPEISHVFRTPEARPPSFAADIFAILCAVPLLICIISWLRIGINFGNLPVSLWPIGFHVGLTAIFGLYVLFWIKLNMFTTLKYLAFVSVPTYFFGQRLFNSLAAQRKA